MNCPRCGTTMNHHADKVVEPATPEDVEAVDEVVGGLLEELFACPNCGYVDSRRAEPEDPGAAG